jgi:ribosomal protein S18 acetylase RimI-like enzyme
MYYFFKEFCVMNKKDISTLHNIHPWHERYIRLTDDIAPLDALELHRSIFSEKSKKAMQQLGDRSYAPGKWTVREILQHLIDTERILGSRALCIARNEQVDLPNYDEAAYGQYVDVGNRTVDDMLQEFDLARQSTLLLYKSFNDQMLRRVGTAAGKRISVLAIAYVLAGHPLYHLRLLNERYLPLILQDVSIVINAPEFLPAFETLNKAWIEKDFELEAHDHYLLGNPQEAILEKGGVIIYAVENGTAIGTAALQPIENGEWKLVKMAVDEAHRGKGIGKLLTRASLNEAKKMGISRLVLFSNTQFNTAAVRLYRRVGFEEIPFSGAKFKRANIKMQINL